MGPYFAIGLAAFAAAFILTPGVVLLSTRLGAIDRPNDRKVHANPTPTLGGTAIFCALMIALALAVLIPKFNGVYTRSSELVGIVAGAFIIFALGAVDDLKDLPAPVKLAGQVFASGILFLSGVKIRTILLPGNEVSIGLSDDVSVLVTVIWLVAMINAVNLIDGLDGLAAGIVAIASASFFVYTFQTAQTFGDSGAAAPYKIAPLVAIALVGATLGFLRFNFHPARIFMGDSGSMLLGLVLGGATISGVSNSPVGLSPSNAEVFLAYFPLLIPMLVLAIPLMDAAFAIVRRARRRRNVFHADKEHLHHRLMDLGHGHRAAVLVMYVWSALAAGAALAFTFWDRDQLVFALPIAVGALVLYTLFPLLTKLIAARLRP